MTSLSAGGQGTAIASLGNTPVIIESLGNGGSFKSLTEATRGPKNAEGIVRAAYKDTPLLIEIARCESTFTQTYSDGEVVRGRVNNADVGVMQINEKYHSEKALKMGLDLHTIEGNIAYGKYLYETQGAQPWSASSPCWSKTQKAAKAIEIAKAPSTEIKN